MERLKQMTKHELMEFRKEIMRRQEQNLERYSNRYSVEPADYGYGLMDDYNGEAEEYRSLAALIQDIDKELTRRGHIS